MYEPMILTPELAEYIQNFGRDFTREDARAFLRDNGIIKDDDKDRKSKVPDISPEMAVVGPCDGPVYVDVNGLHWP